MARYGIFGADAVVDKTPLSASLIAATAVRCYALSKFDYFRKTDPALQAAIARAAAAAPCAPLCTHPLVQMITTTSSGGGGGVNGQQGCRALRH